jgi:hypothetical protein
MERVELTLDTPATYQIRVRGYLDGSWSDRLGGLAIIPTSEEDGTTVTTLHGQLRDQAALAGVLSALYNLQLPLLSVECLRGCERAGECYPGVSEPEHR